MTPRELQRLTRWDTLSDGCVALALDTGLIEFCGAHAVGLFDVDPSTVAGQPFTVLLDPQARGTDMVQFIDTAIADLGRGGDEVAVRGWHAGQYQLALKVNFVRLTTTYAAVIIHDDGTAKRTLNEMVRTELEVLRALREQGKATFVVGPVGFQRDNFGQINTEGQFGYLHNGNRSPYVVAWDGRLDVISGAIEDRSRKLRQADITGSFQIHVHVNGARIYTYDHPGPASVFHHAVATDVQLSAGDELVLTGAPRNVNPTTAEIGVSVHLRC